MWFGDKITLLLIVSAIVLLAIRLAIRNKNFFRPSLAKSLRKKLGRQPDVFTTALVKPCPQCAEQLPLSTLVCNNCDYNFLSMSVGLRHKLLPAPDAAPSHG